MAQTPSRPIGKPAASTPLNAWRTSVQELPDGRVLVVDSLKRLVLLDSTLAFIKVIVDSIPAIIRPPWPTTSFLIPTTRGEVLLVDGVRPMYSRVLGDSVVESNRPLPRPDLTNLYVYDNMGGRPAIDARGRLIYSALQTYGQAYWATGDSAFLFGLDLLHPPAEDNRALPRQTFAAVAQYNRVDSDGRTRPILPNDFWTVVSDGVVTLRANGVDVEKWSVDGSRVAAGKLPYQKAIIGLAEKQRIVDSVRASAIALKARLRDEPVVTTVVDPSELPDKLPAYRGDPPVVDPWGRVWIIENPLVTRRDSTVAVVIDVREHFARLVERRVLPPNARIAAFGANSIYLWRPFGPLDRIPLKP